MASTITTLASAAFAAGPLENPEMLTAYPVGVCSRPYTPTPMETAVPMANATTTGAILVPLGSAGAASGAETGMLAMRSPLLTDLRRRRLARHRALCHQR